MRFVLLLLLVSFCQVPSAFSYPSSWYDATTGSCHSPERWKPGPVSDFSAMSVSSIENGSANDTCIVTVEAVTVGSDRLVRYVVSSTIQGNHAMSRTFGVANVTLSGESYSYMDNDCGYIQSTPAEFVARVPGNISQSMVSIYAICGKQGFMSAASVVNVNVTRDGFLSNITTLPTATPTKVPTDAPTTLSPTVLPTGSPTRIPTISPTGHPTPLPTTSPTLSSFWRVSLLPATEYYMSLTLNFTYGVFTSEVHKSEAFSRFIQNQVLKSSLQIGTNETITQFSLENDADVFILKNVNAGSVIVKLDAPLAVLLEEETSTGTQNNTVSLWDVVHNAESRKRFETNLLERLGERGAESYHLIPANYTQLNESVYVTALGELVEIKPASSPGVILGIIFGVLIGFVLLLFIVQKVAEYMKHIEYMNDTFDKAEPFEHVTSEEYDLKSTLRTKDGKQLELQIKGTKFFDKVSQKKYLAEQRLKEQEWAKKRKQKELEARKDATVWGQKPIRVPTPKAKVVRFHPPTFGTTRPTASSPPSLKALAARGKRTGFGVPKASPQARRLATNPKSAASPRTNPSPRPSPNANPRPARSATPANKAGASAPAHSRSPSARTHSPNAAKARGVHSTPAGSVNRTTTPTSQARHNAQNGTTRPMSRTTTPTSQARNNAQNGTTRPMNRTTTPTSQARNNAQNGTTRPLSRTTTPTSQARNNAQNGTTRPISVNATVTPKNVRFAIPPVSKTPFGTTRPSLTPKFSRDAVKSEGKV